MKSKEIDSLTFDQKIGVLLEISERLGINKNYVGVSEEKTVITYFKRSKDTDTIYEKIKAGKIESVSITSH